jgi:hypothetical protein
MGPRLHHPLIIESPTPTPSRGSRERRERRGGQGSEPLQFLQFLSILTLHIWNLGTKLSSSVKTFAVGTKPKLSSSVKTFATMAYWLGLRPHKTVIVGFDFPAARSPSHFPWVEEDHLQAHFTPCQCPNHIATL